jgi:hypothetical protein
MVSLMTKTTRMFVDNIFLGIQKSGTKSRGVLHFVQLRRFYAVLFVPFFCRLREKCGTLWKTTWLHNVDNIRQKDIKLPMSRCLRNFGTFFQAHTVQSNNVYFYRKIHFAKHSQNMNLIFLVKIKEMLGEFTTKFENYHLNYRELICRRNAVLNVRHLRTIDLYFVIFFRV